MKVHLRLGRRRMGLRHVSQLKGPARLGEDLRAALADMVTHRRIRQAHRVVLIDQPGQDPPRRMALLLGRIQVTAQHGVDRGLERLQPRRDPLRGLARRRNRRFQRLTHGAPVHTVLVGQPPNRQPVDPMIAANRRKLLHPRPHPSASTFVTSGPGYPDADHAEAGPVQAVPTVAACRKVGPNQTVKTTPRHHAGGATSSRPPGANSGCHGQLDARRLQALYRIGVDEVCYRHPHRYLTIIGDHDTGTVIDIQPGRSEESLTNFYEQQPDSTLSTIEAVSMDVSKAYRSATAGHLPEATICFDPFHIMQWVNRALDRVYAESATGPGRASMSTADWTAGRWALRTGENKLTDKKRDLVNRIARTNRRIGRAWTLTEQLRDLYRLEHEPGTARRLLRAWITAAKRSRIPTFPALRKRRQQHVEAVIAAVELGISNALIEGINAKSRLSNARGYGHHSAQTLTSMIYLCLGGLHPQLPTTT